MTFLSTIYLTCNPDFGTVSPIQANWFEGNFFCVQCGSNVLFISFYKRVPCPLSLPFVCPIGLLLQCVIGGGGVRGMVLIDCRQCVEAKAEKIHWNVCCAAAATTTTTTTTFSTQRLGIYFCTIIEFLTSYLIDTGIKWVLVGIHKFDSHKIV